MSASSSTVIGGHGRIGHIHFSELAPTADNDSSLGYCVGDLWISTFDVSIVLFVCRENDLGAAVWDVIPGISGFGALVVQNVAGSGAVSKSLQVRGIDGSVIGYIDIKPTHA